ncbi:MAG: ParB/RepB/Spo0J family partition protein [Clostridia bacterium]|nr:ParB/RepB/Spo0J family partition protein [Clostridia bacterium]
MLKVQSATSPARGVPTRVPVANIRPGRSRPRRDISPESIAQLAESIRLHGLISPLVLREAGKGRYELIAGERRLRALKLLGRQWAEATVLSCGDCDCALIALVENLQREELHFLDVAAACRSILDAYPITQDRLAASLSLSPSALANRLRLLKLSDKVQQAVREGGLSERHARALLKLTDEAAQLALVSLAVEKRLSVKQLEACVDHEAARPPKRRSVSHVLRDNRIVINALMDTVRQLSRIGVPVKSRVEEGSDYIDVIVRIATAQGRRTGEEEK